MTTDLFEYLSRAARGEESECPPDVDEAWHVCLANPQEYEAWCLASFGVVVEHVTGGHGPCHGHVRRA
jgi:hypothetical protein